MWIKLNVGQTSHTDFGPVLSSFPPLIFMLSRPGLNTSENDPDMLEPIAVSVTQWTDGLRPGLRLAS